MKNRPFLFQIATSHTNVCNIMLTSLHPLFKVVPPGFDHDLLLLAILIREEGGITSTRSLTGH